MDGDYFNILLVPIVALDDLTSALKINCKYSELSIKETLHKQTILIEQKEI